MTTLKPCPFCGREQNNPVDAGHADDCYFTLHALNKQRVDKADMSGFVDVLASWNQRAQPDELRRFLYAAAGEGFVLDGVDAGDLFMQLFPDAFETPAA